MKLLSGDHMRIINFDFKFKKPKKIFISHIRQEMLVAEAIKEELEYHGYQVVVTPLNKSASQIERISPKVIETMDAVVVLTSPSAMRSQQVWADIAHARLNNVPVIPMVVYGFEDRIPVHTHINAVDDLELGFERLQDALKNRKRYTVNEVNFTPVKYLLRKTLVAVAIFILSMIATVVR